MKQHKKVKCKNCRRLFEPEYRNRKRQRYCDKPLCRKASKAASQKKWLSKEENRNHFNGPENVERVREWRKNNPGYWKRNKPSVAEDPSALQDSFELQTIESIADYVDSDALLLQDLFDQQRFIIIGLTALITGISLQDDMDVFLKRMQQSGQDILFRQYQHKGGKDDFKSPDFKRSDTSRPEEFQLDRSQAGP